MWVHPPTQTFWPPKGLWPWISCVKLPLPRNSWIATIPLVLLLNSMNHSLVELPALLVHNWVSLFWSHTSISYDAYISFGISFILLRKIFHFKQIVWVYLEQYSFFRNHALFLYPYNIQRFGECDTAELYRANKFSGRESVSVWVSDWVCEWWKNKLKKELPSSQFY